MADIDGRGLSGISKCATCLHRQNFLPVTTNSSFPSYNAFENPSVCSFSFPVTAEFTHLGYSHKKDGPQTDSWFPTCSHQGGGGGHGALQPWRGDARPTGQGQARRGFAEENEAGHEDTPCT